MNHFRRGTIPKLEQLPPERRDALVRWLTVDRLTYAEAQARVKAEFGIKTSAAALSSFWHQICVPRQMLAAERAPALEGKILLEVQFRLTPEGAISLTVTTPTGNPPVAQKTGI